MLNIYGIIFIKLLPKKTGDPTKLRAIPLAVFD